MAGNFNWSQYATGGATRPDSFSGMNTDFSSALTRMFEGAPLDVRQNLRVYSGYRSPEKQAELWKGALAKYGDPEIADNWVAPPGRSNHNHGTAADLRFLDPTARQWAHQHAGDFGLAFPLSNENWHVELASARGGSPAVPTARALDTGGPTSGAASPAAPSIAGMFADQTAPTDLASAFDAPDTSLGGLLANFMQQQAARKKQREDEQAAEEARRMALFSAVPDMSPYG